jgi:hypothetical protein
MLIFSPLKITEITVGKLLDQNYWCEAVCGGYIWKTHKLNSVYNMIALNTK